MVIHNEEALYQVYTPLPLLLVLLLSKRCHQKHKVCEAHWIYYELILMTMFYYNFLCGKKSESWNLLNGPRTAVFRASCTALHDIAN